MTVRLTLLYNQPTDPAAFLAYYEATHVPLVRTFPHLSSFTWGKCLPNSDGSEPAYFLTAELTWPDAETMAADRSTEQGRKVGADLANFATGRVTVLVSEGNAPS